MDEDEFKAIDKRLADMSERCDYLISRNRPLTLDTPPKRARSDSGGPVKPVSSVSTQPPVIASGRLAGNEMRRSNGYSPRSCQPDDCDPDGMWAAFERDFDEMVQAHRW